MNDNDQGSDPPLGEDSPWEKAWTLDEMQKGASHWSLAGDAGMLHYLQEFSQKMISSTHKIQEQMNGLVHEAKLTGVRLDNTVNTFIMLANTQFVENRVYEEDIAQDEGCAETIKTKKPEMTKEERNAALIPRIKGAMSLGLGVLDTAFEKIYVNEANSESEDDDSTNPSDAILEPKDPYLIRPLPYLIGTTAFLQSEGIGLVEEASDDEGSDHGSVSESESAASSSEDEDQRQNGDAKVSKVSSTRHHSSSSSSEAESESDGDLFGGNDSDLDGEKELKDEGRSEVIDTQKTKTDFASELASRMRSSPPPVETTSKTKKRSSYKEDPFAPPSLDSDEGEEEDDSPFSRNAGLFSTGGGLFDDNDDEDGLFHDDPFVGDKNSTKGIVSQNRNSITDVGKKENIAAGKKEEKEHGKSAVKKPAPRGLFDDDQDDDDLFAALAPKKTPVKPAQQATPTRSKSGLFADEDDKEDDMFRATEQKTSSSKKSIPAGAVSMFGGAPNPLVAAIKAQKSPRSDTDEEQTWSDEGNQSSLSSASVSTNSATRSSLRKEHSPSASSNSLFAEEPEDLFAGSQGKRESLGKSGGGSGGALTSSAGGAGLFSDDEDLFAPSIKPQVAAPSPARARKSGLLFDVEDDDDSDFLSGAVFKGSASTKKVESDLFGGAETTHVPETKPSEVERKSPVTPRKTTLSLFEDDDDDLFAVTSPVTKPGATSSPSPKPTAQQPGAGSKSLFQDEGDWLFGGVDDNGPTVDLFGSNDTTKAKEITKQTPPTATEGTTTKSSYRDETAPAAAEASPLIEDEEADHIAVKPKKLPGAVSMFGSVDPTMVGRNTPVGSPLLAVKPALPKRPGEQLAKSPSGETKMKVDGPSGGMVKSEVESVRKSRTTSDIKTRQANLSLNPSALLPGASLPQRRATAGAGGTLEEAASFDEPAKIPVLQSVSKDRARVQAKRRPPSRKNRLMRNDDTDAARTINKEADVESGHTPSTAGSATGGDLSSPSEDKLTVSNNVQKARLFSDDVDDSLGAGTVIGGDSRTRNVPFSGSDDSTGYIVSDSNVTLRSSFDRKDATERLFDDTDKSPTGFRWQDSKVNQTERSNIEQLHPAAEIMTKVSVSSSDELFPTSHIEGATRPTIKPTTDLFAESDDVGDIFGDKKKAAISSVTHSIEGDDVFGSSFSNASTTQAQSSDTVLNTSKDAIKVVPPGADEFDDIFADSKMKGQKPPAKGSRHEKSPQSDEDDIFGAVSRPIVHHRLKKAVSRDEDIFADDTDIFADLNTSKTKPKKTKAKTGPTKSLFSSNDIDDDIFSDVPSKSKQKTKKTPKPSSAATKSPSIFDEDSPSIFDDPLNALGH